MIIHSLLSLRCYKMHKEKKLLSLIGFNWIRNMSVEERNNIVLNEIVERFVDIEIKL